MVRRFVASEMYGPPLCRKRKMRVACWSAQMYSAFVGAVLRARMECAALRSPLVRQSLRTSSEFGFGKRRVRPLCHLMVRQQTWQDLKFRSRRWFADVGIA